MTYDGCLKDIYKEKMFEKLEEIKRLKGIINRTVANEGVMTKEDMVEWTSKPDLPLKDLGVIIEE